VKHKIRYKGSIWRCNNISSFIKKHFPSVIGGKKDGKIYDLMQIEDMHSKEYEQETSDIEQLINLKNLEEEEIAHIHNIEVAEHLEDIPEDEEERYGDDTQINEIVSSQIEDLQNNLYVPDHREIASELWTKYSDVDLELFSSNSPEGLYMIRHSLSHLMAHVIKNIYPEIHLGQGPATDDGFFYDFQGMTISTKDFSKIEEGMRKLIDQKINIRRIEISKKDFLKNSSDLLKNLIVNEIPEDRVSIYQQDEFSDVCKGPHVPNTSFLPKSFKITSVSEVTWKEVKVQRIRAIAFYSQEELEEFEDLQNTNEARDHRKIGKKMDLFSFCEFSPGMPFWHPKGLILVNKLKKIVKKYFPEYHEISTPEIFKNTLWKKTGHLDQYSEYMFLMEEYGIKPMNCPAHILFFNQEQRSYKCLPFRIFEFGSCFRNEDEGGLMGLKRVRKLVQDDGHIICSRDQIHEEVRTFLYKSFLLYEELGFKDKYMLKIATKPEKSIGSSADWTIAEEILFAVVREMKVDFKIDAGGGAFYGPKIEIHIQDRMKRWWQCGTIQVDFFISSNLGISFINSHSQKETPIVLHRASLGSIERFIAILLEHYEVLPAHLHPMPIEILPVGLEHIEYAKEVRNKILPHFSCEIIEEGSISKRIKMSVENRIPYTIILGNKEKEKRLVTLRNIFGIQSQEGIEDFINIIK
jgi:threonyl-tRNA synthetase